MSYLGRYRSHPHFTKGTPEVKRDHVIFHIVSKQWSWDLNFGNLTTGLQILTKNVGEKGGVICKINEKKTHFFPSPRLRFRV